MIFFKGINQCRGLAAEQWLNISRNPKEGKCGAMTFQLMHRVEALDGHIFHGSEAQRRRLGV